MPTTHPAEITITLNAPSPEQIRLLLPAVQEFLRTMYVRHGDKRLSFWDKQTLFRTKQNVQRKGLFTLKTELKAKPEKTFHQKLSTHLTTLAQHRKTRTLAQTQLEILSRTTDATLHELADLAVDITDSRTS